MSDESSDDKRWRIEAEAAVGPAARHLKETIERDPDLTLTAYDMTEVSGDE
jgi:hypothetical protein